MMKMFRKEAGSASLSMADGLNIHQYLYLVLLYMPDYINEPDGIEDMMPWSEFMKAQCSEVKHPDREIQLKK